MAWMGGMLGAVELRARGMLVGERDRERWVMTLISTLTDSQNNGKVG